MNKLITRRNNAVLIGFKATSQFLSGFHLPTRLMHKRTIPKRLWGGKGGGRGHGGKKDTRGRVVVPKEQSTSGEVYLITSSILVVTALGGPCCRLLSYESRPFHPFHPSKTRTHLVSFPAPPSFSFFCLRLTLVWRTNLKRGGPTTGSRVYPLRRLFAFYPSWHLQQSSWAWGVVVVGNRWPPIIGRLANDVAKNYCTVSKNKRYGRNRRAGAFYDVCTTLLNQRVNRFAWFPLDFIRLFNARPVSKSLSWNTMEPDRANNSEFL